MGRHLLLTLSGISSAALRDEALARTLIADVAAALRVVVMKGPEVVVFPGGGLTGFAVLAESHISLHSYPESGVCAVDVFTCGEVDPAGAIPLFREGFGARGVSSQVLIRSSREGE